MPESELIASLISRIEQLEERQNVVSKYMVGLKRQFDGMTEGLQQIEYLKEQVSELQQRFNQLVVDNVEMTDASSKAEKIDDAETVRRFFERVDRLENQEAMSIRATSFSESVIDADEVGMNADIEKEREKEFKIERMLLLLGAYSDEEQSQDTPIDAEEFLRRYNNDERDFTGINLTGANLSGTNLSETNLSRANLTKAILQSANLIQANLSKANLSEANLFGAKLYVANLSKANLSKANFDHANLSMADLSDANLSKANLNHANLATVNLM